MFDRKPLPSGTEIVVIALVACCFLSATAFYTSTKRLKTQGKKYFNRFSF